MRFYLCGDFDAPDWVLAEISTLSQLSPECTKDLSQSVIEGILTGSFKGRETWATLSESTLSASDFKAAVAAIHYIIANAAKYDVNGATVSRELQQWGLPREHSEAIADSYRSAQEALQSHLVNTSLQVSPLAVVGWQVRAGDAPSVLLELKAQASVEVASKTPPSHQFFLPADKFRLLLHELQQAKALMDGPQ